ncbi:RNA polymerase sigma-70 factor [Chitinophaga filiformis]|uniref:RNA polymerase sigma-70 factor n=1 Tax=Chitinophaga filiformis TaxID=104663 RepID=UPI001F476F03|nr:RNA polymerase sigma-70 factor [Chitinophaga filiformis]MCF6405044.1 RNA polymerase sigma-70 factor [Chitinophaga filiformis]
MDRSYFSDDELLISMATGDEAAFTEIYHRYWRRLLAIAYHHTQDESAAKEIVQEVLINLWDRRAELEIRQLSQYLATAIKFSVFKSITREKRRNSIAADVFGERTSQDDERIYARFLHDYINGIVEQLPEKCRQVFKSSRMEGKGTAQIARELNISEKTVESHITKALKHIRYGIRNAGLFLVTLLAFFR